MIGEEYASSDTASRSEGYEEAGKARPGGMKIFDRKDPFIHAENDWMAWMSEERWRDDGRFVSREKENGVEEEGSECMRDHAWEFRRWLTLPLTVRFHKPCLWLGLAIREGCTSINELSMIS